MSFMGSFSSIFRRRRRTKGVESVLFDVFRRPPYPFENGMARGGTPLVAHEEFKQEKFRRGEMDFSSPTEDAPLGDLQRQIADYDLDRKSTRLNSSHSQISYA